MSVEGSAASRSFGERVVELRYQYGLTREELAELAQMDVSNVGRIERGKGNPSLTTIVRIAAALEVDPAVLVKGMSVDMLPEKMAVFTVKDYIAEKKRRNAAR